MPDIFIRSALLAGQGITGLFTTRRGGVSQGPYSSLNFGMDSDDSADNVAENIMRLCSGAALPRLPHQARQVHGSESLWCRGEGQLHDQQADALLSDEAGAALAVRTADCLPVLLADPTRGIIAAVHAGWRGTVANVVSRTAEAMVHRGSEARDILASLGPCIGPCCFSIDTGTAAEIATCSPRASNHVRCQASTCSADLAAINREQLLATGLVSDHIEVLSTCTACHPESFYSHRRDRGVTGRHLAVVALPAST